MKQKFKEWLRKQLLEVLKAPPVLPRQRSDAWPTPKEFKYTFELTYPTSKSTTALQNYIDEVMKHNFGNHYTRSKLISVKCS